MRLIITTLLLALTFASCKKWLDVQPESTVADDVLFSTQEGFEEALLGVYTAGSKSQLYGQELTSGTPDVLAQNYIFTDNDNLRYLQTTIYNYKDPTFMGRRDNIWSGLYNVIANCNLILTNIDKKKQLFSTLNYNLIKGEALAMRAYLHFDLLRLFASTNPGAQGIPYVTTYSKDITPMSAVSAVLDSAISDLTTAKQLLATDPILSASYVVGYPTVSDTLQNTEEGNKTLFLQNRRHRMNYYAVCGTLARVYLYKKDKANALVNALEVINSNKFPWTKSSDFLAVDDKSKDRILYKELIFGWYIPGMAKTDKEKYFQMGTGGMHMSENQAKIIYETGGVGADDLRYKQWFSLNSLPSGNIVNILKYYQNLDNTADDANLHYLMAPAIRLAEMYYIAAECTYASDPAKAVGYLNTVRTRRNIGVGATVNNEEQLYDELLKDCRKECYAEGQIFYMYKRLNRAIINPNGNTIPASDQVFVLPLPNDEILYGGR